MRARCGSAPRADAGRGPISPRRRAGSGAFRRDQGRWDRRSAAGASEAPTDPVAPAAGGRTTARIGRSAEAAADEDRVFGNRGHGKRDRRVSRVRTGLGRRVIACLGSGQAWLRSAFRATTVGQEGALKTRASRRRSAARSSGSRTGVYRRSEQAPAIASARAPASAGPAAFGVPDEDGGPGWRNEDPAGIASAFGRAEQRKRDRRVSPVRTGLGHRVSARPGIGGGRLRSVSRTNMVGRGGAMKTRRASHRRSHASISVACAARSRPRREAADVDRIADDRPAAFGQVRDTVGRQRLDQAVLFEPGRRRRSGDVAMWRCAAMAISPPRWRSRRKMAEHVGQASSGQPATSPARSSWPSARRPCSTP